MSDLISRQAAMDAIEELISARLNWKSDSSVERQGLNAAMCAIEDLPSAQPEQKTGTWTFIEGKYGEDKYYCSHCGDWNSYGETDYCPYCGAKMR